MSDKRMLIVPSELARKIDENRGDMSQSDFINFLIDSQLERNKTEQPPPVTMEVFQEFEQGIKDLLRNFIEFFVSYGLELGGQSIKGRFEELNKKLQEL